MTHEVIKVTDVSHFEFFETKREMDERAKELQKQGIVFHFGGKRSQSRQTYHDIVIAAIYHNHWSGSGLPWVIAW